MKTYLKYIRGWYEYGMCGMISYSRDLGRGADILDIEVQMLDHHMIGPEHETHTLITTI